MNEKTFTDVARLRKPERLATLEIDRVIELCLTPASGVESVLDVGTGSGVFAEAFAKNGLRVAGVDPNPAMLEAARPYLPQAELKEGIAEALPFDDNSFDLVFMGMVLHEVDDPTKALQEAARVSTTQVAILEWPYEVGESGPPQAHRLTEEQIKSFAEAANLTLNEMVPLASRVLYRFNKG